MILFNFRKFIKILKINKKAAYLFCYITDYQ
jgi:hypothetical protein